MRIDMGKGLLRKIKEGIEPTPPTPMHEQYIDLGEIEFEEESGGGGMEIKVAELLRYDDIGSITNEVYNGNILFIDFSNIANDELQMKRVTAELKSVIRDVHGDLAGIGKNYLIVTPTGVKIDRKVIKGSY
ncbi:MAG: cell division protein SepF [Candidatus Thermoplasmatota archaeon]